MMIRRCCRRAWLLAAALVVSAAPARADVTLRLLAVDPEPPATLGRQQRLNLQVGDDSDQRIQISAEAFGGGRKIALINGGVPLRDGAAGEGVLSVAAVEAATV